MAGKKKIQSKEKRKWFFMPTLDCYILREFMIKFSILLLISTILFLLSDVLADLSDFIEKGASWQIYIPYFLLKIPGNIRFILPIAMLLGCMWTMATFGKNMEVTAMRASGVSLFRCGRSILAVGMLTTFVNIWFNEGLVPYTDRKAFALKAEGTRDDKSRKKKDLEEQKLVYRSPDKKRTWLFERDKNSGGELGVGVQANVQIKFSDGNGRMEKVMDAKNAIYRDDVGWRFSDIAVTEYFKDIPIPKTYHLESFDLGTDDAQETPVDIQYSVKPVEELPSWVIYDLVTRTKDMPQHSYDVYWTVFFYRLAFPWSCFLAVFLGIPLATKSERNGILTSIITAVVIIVGYIVAAQIFLVIGKQGHIHPMIAGLAPTIAFIAYGIDRVVRNQS